ncbi:unnamed protein product, partial [Pylaiella littoralis]
GSSAVYLVCSQSQDRELEMVRRREATKMKTRDPRNPCREDLRCVVHDRVWVYHDILLVDGLDSRSTVANVKARVSELRDIPGNNMEVVIFYVNGGGGERCATASD